MFCKSISEFSAVFQRPSHYHEWGETADRSDTGLLDRTPEVVIHVEALYDEGRTLGAPTEFSDLHAAASYALKLADDAGLGDRLDRPLLVEIVKNGQVLLAITVITGGLAAPAPPGSSFPPG
jgi:hypothetical protein